MAQVPDSHQWSDSAINRPRLREPSRRLAGALGTAPGKSGDEHREDEDDECGGVADGAALAHGVHHEQVADDALGDPLFAPGRPAYDAALHAWFLGFVFSMVFGHAPIIVPAVLRVALPYRAWFYLPLVVLHASLAERIVGDLLMVHAVRQRGAIGNAAALVIFILTMLVAGLSRRRS